MYSKGIGIREGGSGGRMYGHPKEPLAPFFFHEPRAINADTLRTSCRTTQQSNLHHASRLRKSGVGRSSQIFNLETRLPLHCGGTSVSAGDYRHCSFIKSLVGLVTCLFLSSLYVKEMHVAGGRIQGEIVNAMAPASVIRFLLASNPKGPLPDIIIP